VRTSDLGVEPVLEKVMLADAPLAYWRVGETAGPIAVDATAHHDDAIYAGAMAFDLPGAIATDANPAVRLDNAAVGVGVAQLGEHRRCVLRDELVVHRAFGGPRRRGDHRPLRAQPRAIQGPAPDRVLRDDLNKERHRREGLAN